MVRVPPLLGLSAMEDLANWFIIVTCFAFILAFVAAIIRLVIQPTNAASDRVKWLASAWCTVFAWSAMAAIGTQILERVIG